MNRTITPRMKIWKENLGLTGWHVHTTDAYLGFYDFEFTSIVASSTLSPLRLTGIMGNVLYFEK